MNFWKIGVGSDRILDYNNNLIESNKDIVKKIYKINKNYAHLEAGNYIINKNGKYVVDKNKKLNESIIKKCIENAISIVSNIENYNDEIKNNLKNEKTDKNINFNLNPLIS